jgi:hypothetical protein
MQAKSKGHLAWLAIKIIVGVSLFVSWWQFFWPPVEAFRRRNDDYGFWDVVWQLAQPNNDIYSVPFLGWAFLALSVAFAFLALHYWRRAINYLDNSRVGISVLSTTITVEMQDAERTMAIMHREQAFHANRKGITAYRMDTSTDTSTGRILRNTLTQESHAGNKLLTKDLILRGNDSTLEVIERFENPLPTNWLATYLPNFIVCMLHDGWFFDDVVVERKGAITLQNEFNCNEGVYQINSTKYPISRTKIRLAFIVGSEPPQAQVKGFIVKENVVEEVDVKMMREQTHVIYEVKAPNLHLESLRIQWEFKPVVKPEAQSSK